MNEKVLCIPAHMSYEDIERFVDVESLYISREEAETDDNYRQIIPYCIFFNNDSQRFLIYKRTKIGKETRLRDKYSIGVGGHVNPSDGFGWEAINNAMRREAQEELGVIPRKTLGDIYIELNESDVDRVHLGIARLVYGYEEILKPSNEIVSWDYVSIQDLLKYPLESWSKFCVERIVEDWGEWLGLLTRGCYDEQIF
ncbi:MAG TPA: NUDIX domain-containing protein [Thermotogota bacterium]|nr:NUDIX domain-containing protein [Thermotogota bacterium]HPM21808.1 NUDIX domain-containing protein [Thermotogota bacterium]